MSFLKKTGFHLKSFVRCKAKDAKDYIKTLLEFPSEEEVVQMDIFSAVEAGYLEEVQRLHAAGQDLHSKNENGESLLHIAAENGHLDIFLYLTHMGLKPLEARDNDGKTVLHAACSGGEFMMADFLLRKYSDMKSVRDKENISILHSAVRSGNFQLFDSLVTDHSFNVYALTNKGQTVLHTACQFGRKELVLNLSKNPKLKDMCDHYGWTALHYAARFGFLDIFKWLIENKMHVYQLTGQDQTVLHLACQHGQLELVEYIASTFHGLKKAKDKRGYSNLHYAAMSDNLEVFRFLVGNKCQGDQAKTEAYVSGLAKNGATILHVACQSGQADTVQYLVSRYKRILIFRLDKNGFSCLHYAAEGGSREIFQILAKEGLSGIDYYKSKECGATVLQTACKFGRYEMTKYLIQKYPFLLGIEDNVSNTVLHYAAEGGNIDILKYIEEQDETRKSVFRRNKGCSTILHTACLHGQLQMVSFIWGSYSDLRHAADDKGCTALHYAADGGNVQILKLLIDSGLDTMISNTDGENVLHRACKLGHRDIVTYLVKNYPELRVTKTSQNLTALDLVKQNGHEGLLYLIHGEQPDEGQLPYASMYDHDIDQDEETTTAIDEIQKTSHGSEDSLLQTSSPNFHHNHGTHYQEGTYEHSFQDDSGVASTDISKTTANSQGSPPYHRQSQFQRKPKRVHSKRTCSLSCQDDSGISCTSTSSISVIPIAERRRYKKQLVIPIAERRLYKKQLPYQYGQRFLVNDLRLQAWLYDQQCRANAEVDDDSTFLKRRNTTALQDDNDVASLAASDNIASVSVVFEATNIQKQLKRSFSSGDVSAVMAHAQSFQSESTRSSETLHTVLMQETTSQDMASLVRLSIKEDNGTSKETAMLLQSLCARVENRVGNIKRVWAGYKPQNLEEPVLVAVVNENPVSNIDSIESFQLVFRHDGQVSDEARFIAMEEMKKQMRFSSEEFDKLHRCLAKHSKRLVRTHSNVQVVSASKLKSRNFGTKDFHAEPTTCIVVYVHVKGIIPFGEEPFPAELDGFPVDIREGIFRPYTKPNEYHKNLQMGCQIWTASDKGGSLGAFVDLGYDELGNMKIGCLTCRHIFIPKNGEDDVEDLRYSREVFQPSNTNEQLRFGRLVKHSHHPGNERRIGVDAGLIEITDPERIPVNGHFPNATSNIAGFSAERPMVYNSGNIYTNFEEVPKTGNVVKYGAVTEHTVGQLRLAGTAVHKEKYPYHLDDEQTQTYELYNQFEIFSVISEDQKSFSLPGDSGSLVLLVNDGNDEYDIRGLGLLVGGTTYNSAIVTPIWAVLNEFELPMSLLSFDQSNAIKARTTRTRLDDIEKNVSSLQSDMDTVKKSISNLETSSTDLKQGMISKMELNNTDLKQEMSENTKALQRFFEQKFSKT